MEEIRQEDEELKMEILNYFDIRRKQIEWNKPRKKSKLKTDIYRHLNFDELSTIFSFLDWPSLLEARLINRKANIAACYAMNDNYVWFKDRYEPDMRKVYISSGKVNLLK